MLVKAKNHIITSDILKTLIRSTTLNLVSKPSICTMHAYLRDTSHVSSLLFAPIPTTTLPKAKIRVVQHHLPNQQVGCQQGEALGILKESKRQRANRCDRQQDLDMKKIKIMLNLCKMICMRTLSFSVSYIRASRLLVTRCGRTFSPNTRHLSESDAK